ncbi:hypothetical protein [Moheibacter lacus]|uniref:hypothetical protein n=1 Tax=Moheibacter lacus TaxID=2745851 RepID=UPI0015F71455|nr:hypothetical protein [Moheibacter lacus]
MHGFTQGVITGVSGGDFYQGFWAASVSSVVSSAVPALGNKVNFMAKNETMSTLFFGTASGGLSAKLTRRKLLAGRSDGVGGVWVKSCG